MRKTVHVLNGPNLNLLGQREPHLYGSQTLADLEAMCRDAAALFGWGLVFGQTNHQGEMIDMIHAARGAAVGLVINPAAFCYGSVGILDALHARDCPAVEVHITNIHGREPEWRAHTITAAGCDGMISGLGLNGYVLAIRQLAHLVQAPELSR